MSRLSASRRSAGLCLATWEHAERVPGVLNLAIGQPAQSLLPTAAMQQAASTLFSAFDPRHLLQYGSPSGSEHYLVAVADFLTAQLGHPHAPANLFATPGNSGGLSLVTRTLTRPGDFVLIEEPSYFLAHQIFRDHHLELIPVPQRADGAATIDLEHLSRVLSAAADGQRPAPKLLYCVPTGNNPTGRTMPDADRARLVRLCAQHAVVIVADDVYELLQWEMATAPKPLRWHAAQQHSSGTVISLGSWSKLLGPGLRLGWLEAEPELVEAFAADGEVDSGALTSPLIESLVTAMLTSGDAQAHVVALRSTLCRRASLLANAINAEQPAGTPPIVHAAPAGYFLWVDLCGLDGTALRDRCQTSHGVAFLPGTASR